MRATLLQVNVSRGGMPKRPVMMAAISAAGLEGDWQKNRKYHGGPDRAICLYSEELYAWLRDECGVDLSPGDLGENFTTIGLDLLALSPGDRLRVGGADGCTIELTAVREPCRQLKLWHPNLHKTIIGRSGWMARVLKAGWVKPGDSIQQL